MLGLPYIPGSITVIVGARVLARSKTFICKEDTSMSLTVKLYVLFCRKLCQPFSQNSFFSEE